MSQKSGYSSKGFFGETNHYDSSGKKTGYSQPGIFGGVDHYDAKGDKVGHSDPGIFGGMDHYDAKGNKAGHSDPGIFGGMDHYSESRTSREAGNSSNHTQQNRNPSPATGSGCLTAVLAAVVLVLTVILFM